MATGNFFCVGMNFWSLRNELLSFSAPHHSCCLHSTGEFLSLAAMDTFLRSVQPEVNDLFVLSLVLINLLAWMDLFITQVRSCACKERAVSLELFLILSPQTSSCFMRF